MSFLSSLAEQALSSVASGSHGSSQDVRKTGGQEYNAPHNGQQPQGHYNAQEVLSHADTEEHSEYIANAVQHVNDNSEQHHAQLSSNELATYAPMIMQALSSLASKHGMDASSFVASGKGGGNQLMGAVMKEVAGNFMGGASGQQKQGLMNGAAMTLTKIVAQKQLSAFTGGSNSGGLGMLEMGQSLLKRFA